MVDPVVWLASLSYTDRELWCASSSSSRNEYDLGGIIALLLQDHRTMSTKSVCSSQYILTDQQWVTGTQTKHSTLSDVVCVHAVVYL